MYLFSNYQNPKNLKKLSSIINLPFDNEQVPSITLSYLNFMAYNLPKKCNKTDILRWQIFIDPFQHFYNMNITLKNIPNIFSLFMFKTLNLSLFHVEADHF